MGIVAVENISLHNQKYFTSSKSALTSVSFVTFIKNDEGGVPSSRTSQSDMGSSRKIQKFGWNRTSGLWTGLFRRRHLDYLRWQIPQSCNQENLSTLQSVIHAKRTYRELRMLKHMNH